MYQRVSAPRAAMRGGRGLDAAVGVFAALFDHYRRDAVRLSSVIAERCAVFRGRKLDEEN